MSDTTEPLTTAEGRRQYLLELAERIATRNPRVAERLLADVRRYDEDMAACGAPIVLERVWPEECEDESDSLHM